METLKELEVQGYWIESDFRTIKPGTYKEFLEEMCLKTTTPLGVKPKVHLKEVINKHDWTEDGEYLGYTPFYLEDCNGEANEVLERIKGVNPYSECTLFYELWDWGLKGNNPKRIDSYHDKDKALLELYSIYEEENQYQELKPPEFYLKYEDAEERVINYQNMSQ